MINAVLIFLFLPAVIFAGLLSLQSLLDGGASNNPVGMEKVL